MIWNEQKKEFICLKEIRDKLMLKDLSLKISPNNCEYKNEMILQKITQKTRTEWLETVGKTTAKFDRSPWEGEIPKDVFGNDIQFTYERLIDDIILEKKYAYEIDNYFSQMAFYKNGMAAIKGTIDCINSFLKVPIKLKNHTKYFETEIYLKTLQNFGIEVYPLGSSYKDCNVFFFEPMKYDFSANVLKEELLINEINATSSNLIFVLMDSTMHNKTKIFEHLQDKISSKKDVIYVDIRSGLKLDQFGLELLNFGIVEWFVHKKNVRLKNILFSYISKYRGFTGTNLSYNEIVTLSYPRSIDDSSIYCSKVNNNVLDFVSYLGSPKFKNSYITDIRHSQGLFLNEKINQPFLYFKINEEDRSESYDKFLHYLQNEFSKKNLFFPFRNSWGFRYPSIEYIQNQETNEIMFKLYLGVYKGVVWHDLAKIFIKLTSDNTANYFER